VLCFDSNFLERKLQGLKSLQEMISALKVGNFRFYTAEHMVKNYFFSLEFIPLKEQFYQKEPNIRKNLRLKRSHPTYPKIIRSA